MNFESAFKRRVLKLISILAVLSIPIVYMSHRSHSSIVTKQRKIVCELDSDAIINAMTLMQRNASSYKRDPAWSNTDNYIDPNDPGLPLLIRQLQPSYILVTKEVITLEFGGGSYHFGLVITSNPSLPVLKTKNLKGNLWYYSEDSSVPSCR